MQDAFATALERWPRDGVPRQSRAPGSSRPPATGAIDRIRRERVLADKTELLARLEVPADEDADE